MAHRNQIFAAINLASILGLASLGNAQAAELVRSSGIFWSAIGGTGQVHSGQAALALNTRAGMSMAAPGSLTLRFSVPPSAELASASGLLHFVMNLSDPGAGVSVSAMLLEVQVGSFLEPPIASPATRVLLTATSSDMDATSGFANRCVAGSAIAPLDFDRNVYYVQVTMNWDGKAPPPMLRALQLGVYDANVCK